MNSNNPGGVIYCFVVFLLFCDGVAQQRSPDRTDWWNIPYPESFKSEAVKSADFIRVDGKHLVDDDGNVKVFCGLNISDPDKLVKDGKWSKRHFEVIKQWGADLVRVPVHPIAWRSRGEADYIKLLDQAILWASELDIYLIFDWHSIGNLPAGLFQHKIYETDLQETLQFWRTIARRYKDIPTVAFYEIFNEPTDFGGQLGTLTWKQWKAVNEEIIKVIFAHDKTVIPLVAGFNWGYDLSHVKEEPLGITGIGYVAHPYPQKTAAPWIEAWEKTFGFVADQYPVIATEFGFMAADDPGAHIPCIGDETYGTTIVEYFDKKGISWTVWCFDPDWVPQMISDWSYTATRQGKFFRSILAAK
jgi:aryl-phospho-beta-D-glucosidase BglC (GH1 family)